MKTMGLLLRMYSKSLPVNTPSAAGSSQSKNSNPAAARSLQVGTKRSPVEQRNWREHAGKASRRQRHNLTPAGASTASEPAGAQNPEAVK
jgi:hypothetical protein